MKLALAIGLGIILILIGTRIFGFLGEQHMLGQNLADVQTRLDSVKAQQADLEAEQKYLANPANMVKELRARFNYKKPGETMIIIVPPATGQP
jgi:cell division protein FtsB